MLFFVSKISPHNKLTMCKVSGKFHVQFSFKLKVNLLVTGRGKTVHIHFHRNQDGKPYKRFQSQCDLEPRSRSSHMLTFNTAISIIRTQ